MIVPADGDSFARAIAEAYAAETKAAVTFRITSSMDIRAGGFFHKHTFEEEAYAESADAALRKRVLRSVEDGKVADADALKAQSSEAESPLGRFGMKLPITPDAVGDYTFGKPHDEGDTVTLDFKATVRDEAHGDGTLTYLRDENRVATIVYRPAVLPAHATSLVATIEYAKVTDDRWDVVKISRTFAGKLGIITGGGSSASLFEEYRTFPSDAAASADVDEMHPKSG